MSKKTKTPIVVTLINSEEGLASVVNAYVERSILLASRKAELEARIAALNREFEEANAALIRECDVALASAQLYAESRPDLFAGSAAEGHRSRVYRNAVVGFRTNPPKVEKRVGKDTWDAIIQRLKASPWGYAYLNVPAPVIDKEGLLRDRANLDAGQLAAVGIEIVQHETFFVKPAFETVTAATKEAA